MHIQYAASIAKILNRERDFARWVPPKTIFHGRLTDVLIFPVYISTIGRAFDLHRVPTGRI